MDGIFVDGITMCWWLRWVWHIKVPRLSFDMSGIAADLFARLDNTPTENIYFIGAKQEQLEATIEQIKIAYPMLKIAGFRNGYFLTDEQRKSEIENIVRLSPSFVVVGMGSPLQEQFVLDLKDADYSGIAFTCGGFLHQTAEGINYYPKWINKYNLRAFYRLYKEKGLFKRLYNVLLEFPILLVYDSLHYKRYK
jgi:N-acetylglucosaminyldiphosphoundecaprenol N-acetyl-beta-D-mannosaminyltransferase